MNLLLTAKNIHIDSRTGDTRVEMEGVQLDQSLDVNAFLQQADLWAVMDAMKAMGWSVTPPAGNSLDFESGKQFKSNALSF